MNIMSIAGMTRNDFLLIEKDQHYYISCLSYDWTVAAHGIAHINFIFAS